VATKIPEDMVDFLESGVSILVGTRNENNEPEPMRSGGAFVSKDREHLSLLFPAHNVRSLANVEANGQIAVCFSRMLDNYSIQLKGGRAVVRDGTDEDRAVAERYRVAYGEQLHMAGFPRGLTSRINVWPAKVVTFPVRDIFVQTPGPGAGARLGDKR
jgi:hypothetical protein